MLKIGEFSKLSRVSVRMLRHYDEIGLLKPAEIDRFTDYRYYREDQLPTAGRIAALKDMGFSLTDIVKILEVYDDREQLERFFLVRQRELEALSQDTAHKLTLLDAARKRLRKEEEMRYNVTIKTIPERYAAVIAWIEANGYAPAAPMFNIYHVSPHETQDPDAFVTEICYPVKKK